MILPTWTKSLALRKSFNLIRKSKWCRWLSWLRMCEKYLPRSSLTSVVPLPDMLCIRGGEEESYLFIYLLLRERDRERERERETMFSVVWLCSDSRTDMPTVRPCELWPPGPPSWIHSFSRCGQPGLHRLHTTPHHTTPHHTTIPPPHHTT